MNFHILFYITMMFLENFKEDKRMIGKSKFKKKRRRKERLKKDRDSKKFKTKFLVKLKDRKKKRKQRKKWINCILIINISLLKHTIINIKMKMFLNFNTRNIFLLCKMTQHQQNNNLLCLKTNTPTFNNLNMKIEKIKISKVLLPNKNRILQINITSMRGKRI